jgi:XTP/dITP diphosphohydrolase
LTTESGPVAGSRLLFATTNPGKVREARALLAPFGFTLVSLADLGLAGEVSEDGADYIANAQKKASHWAEASGLAALAEDSGLEVDALGGAPGVHSARYGGAGVDDRGRNQRVLAGLAGVAAADRGARFVAVVVVMAPGGRELGRAEGECRGRIAAAPRGTGGFGYDPIFEEPESGRTFAELEPEEKSRVSHRGRALRQLAAALAGSGSS